jgi:hypothetical protein
METQPTDLDIRRRASTRSIRAVAAQLVAPVVVVVIGLLVLALDGHEISWLAGLIAGAGAGAWVALGRAGGRPSLHVPHAPHADHRTDAAVKPLESSGWRFLHDIRGVDFTYDHIAIGHGGVIMLQSLSPDGVVTMRSGEPILERRAEPDAEPRLERLRPRALADATAFRDDMERVTGRRLWVQAVVVLWSEFPAGCVTDGHCVYIHGSRLAAWMARRPHQLDLVEAEGVFDAIQLLARTAAEHSVSVAV